MNDFIIKLLNLKQDDLDFIDSVSQLNQADFLITLKVRDHVCPHCASFTHSIKDYKTHATVIRSSIHTFGEVVL